MDVSIWLIFLPAVFSLTDFWTAILHIYHLGKSNSYVKKLSKEKSFLEKMSLQWYVKRCDVHVASARRIYRLYCVYVILLLIGMLLTIFSMILWMLSVECPTYNTMIRYFAKAKFYVVDIPWGLYGMVMSKSDKVRGGVTWRWKKK